MQCFAERERERQRDRDRRTEGHARVAAVRRSDGDVAPFCDFFCTHHDASSVHSYLLLLLLEHRFVSEIFKFIIIISTTVSPIASNCLQQNASVISTMICKLAGLSVVK